MYNKTFIRLVGTSIILAGLLILNSWKNPESDFEVVEVKGGTFEMGCTSEQSNCDKDESPVHSVTVDDFSISKYEITNAEFADFLNEIDANKDATYEGKKYVNVERSDLQYSNGEFTAESGKASHPVKDVSWYGANKFCNFYGGRLPTEAEWEYAARGGSKSLNSDADKAKFSGSSNIDKVAWYIGNSGEHTHEVGTKKPNELGIHDMSGNVWEWCHDRYSSNYYENSTKANPEGPSSGKKRVLRGGSNVSPKRGCRVSDRSSDDPASTGYSGSGFRMVK